MRLLAIDPGGQDGHTGVCLFEYDDETPITLLASWAVPNGVEGFKELYRDELHKARPDVVVCEKFVNRNIPGADLSALLVEGVVRYLYPQTNFQQAAGKNSAVSDEALRNLGLYDIGRGDHHRDRTEAARHAVWLLLKLRHLPTIKSGWPR